MLHRVVYAKTGQVLSHLPARPVASATYEIEDLSEPQEGDDRQIVSGSATISGTSLTTDADAGPREADPRKIPVASTTGASVGAWWIEDALGIGELVLIEGIASGDSLRIRDPLLRAYASGSTVRPLAITAAFPNTQAADEDLIDVAMRVVWVYTIDGRERRQQEQIRIVRQTSLDAPPTEVVDFCRLFAPDLAASLRHRQLEGWVPLAQRLVLAQARSEGLELTQLLAGDRMVEILAWRALQIAGENGYAPGQVEPMKFAAAMRANFDRCWAALTVGAPGLDTATTDEDDEQIEPTERGRLSLAL
jgi:hypothetical protein